MENFGRLWTPPGLSGRQLRNARVKLLGSVAIGCAVAFAFVAALAGCGSSGAPADNAVEATEQNSVRLGGVEYRVVRFRELNPRIPPDRSILDGPPPSDGKGYYAAFVTACNASSRTRTPTSRIHLEDAFGQRFSPLAAASDSVFAYRPRPLEPERCLLAEDSAASRTVDGAAIVFEVPYDAAQERPLILEISRRPDGAGRAAARIQLDL